MLRVKYIRIYVTQPEIFIQSHPVKTEVALGLPKRNRVDFVAAIPLKIN